LTILLQEHGVGGLQVWSDLKGVWIPAPAVEDAFVVNIGNLLQTWTGGYFRSARHRVINEGPHHRYSAPLFYYGNLDAEFTPSEITKNALPTQGMKGATINQSTTVGKYLLGVISAVDNTKKQGAAAATSSNLSNP
jgi:isopenicillin N synthase-like dioxygenase